MKKIAYLLLIAASMYACKKYEEGPFVSFRSAEERLANTWMVKQYFENGVDKTNDFNNVFKDYTLTISKGNSYTLAYKVFGLVNYSESGVWNFNSNKTKVTFKNTNNNTSTWTIIKLYEKELWGEYTDSGNKTIELHLIPK